MSENAWIGSEPQSAAFFDLDRTLISGAHLPFPALGHVKQVGDNSYEFVPAPWRWA